MTTAVYKRKSPEELMKMMTETMADCYEEKAMFNQMIDDIAEGCINTVVSREFTAEVDKQFERFVRENNIQSFDEIEVERRFEQSEGEDGSLTYRVIQEYRKKRE